jgi:hypothetical protein
MRSRPFFVALTVAITLSAVAGTAGAQDEATDPYAGGLVSGNYLRASAGFTSPLNPSGAYRDWDGGTAFALSWENWDNGARGVGRLGFAIGGSYAALPFDAAQFLPRFQSLAGIPATSAHASAASLITVETQLRYRIPVPYLMPSILFGFGYINFHPSKIHYATATAADATTGQQQKSGAVISIGAGLDRQLFDRYALFGEGTYGYGFTSLGAGFANARGTCAVSNDGCDVLKNIALGTLRGGLRVRVGR